MSEATQSTGNAARRVRPNLKDEAATFLRDEIFAGRLKPGDRIDQDQVADDLGISRLPVREALITLEAEGLIETLPRRGAFVARLTRDDVLDQYVIFGTLSGLAAGRAAEILTSDQLDELAALIAAMETSKDSASQEQLNFRFHQIINKAGSSRRLTAVLAQLAKNMPTRFYEFTEDWGERAIGQHKAILEALRTGDPRRAADTVSLHLRSGGEEAVKMLDSLGFWPNED
jgi:DNA-binding GntR family transcriptional regulator